MKPYRYFQHLFYSALILFAAACSFGEEIEGAEEVVIERKFTGQKTTYHENGSPLSVVNYKKDKKDGMCYNYYENGGKHLEVFYRKNKKDGIFKWYYTDGSLYQERNYKNNELHGEYKEFYKSGKLKFVKHYRFGVEVPD